MREFDLEAYLHHFDTHKAKLIEDNERYWAADYCRADGSSEHYINFIVDKKRGSLIISGDLGDCIATWYNKLTPEKINSFIRNDPEYFIKKIQCSTDKYRYDADYAYDEIVNDLTHDGEISRPDDYDDTDEFLEDLRMEIDNSYDLTDVRITERLYDMLSNIDPDYIVNLSYYGRYIAPRVYLWLYAFDQVCKTLIG